MVRVIGIGDNVCDIYLHEKMMYPGGQAFNYAVDARLLEAESAFIGAHADDAVGRHVLSTLKQRRVDHSRTRIYPGKENGFACVMLEEGDRIFKGSNQGGVLQEHPIALTEEDLAYVAGFDAVHMSNNGFTDAELPKLKGLGPLVSYDFSYKWNEPDRIDRVCPYIDCGFASCGAAAEDQIWALAEKMCEGGCRLAVITRGSEGAFAWDGVRKYRQPPYWVKPVDTMGAGDAFAAAVMVTLARARKEASGAALKDRPLWENMIVKALEKAASFSAKACLVRGGSGGGIPVPEELWPRIREISGQSGGANGRKGTTDTAQK